MSTLTGIVQGIGYVATFVGILGFANTIFNLSLRYRGTALPHDYVSAGVILVIGLVLVGIGFLMRRRRG